MKKLAVVFLSLFIVISCSKVPVTGRKQLDILPDSEVLALASNSYQQFLNENKLSNDAQNSAMVRRVGQNIATAVEKYFAQHNMKKQLKDYKWEFNLIESKEQNAWAMPGGKTVVYTGLLPITKDETGLAVVMGHEIAHAVAKHGNERMSQGLLAQMGGVALNVALSNKPQETRSLFMAAYGAGATVGYLLPFSRIQESEADRLGLVFMAMAGYDPRQATEFWKRMDAISKGGNVPEFLSTHPSHDTRIKDIEKNLPEALRYYNESVSAK
jgi:predicted Zn-dependent protease